MEGQQFKIIMDSLNEVKTDVKEIRKSQSDLGKSHSRVVERVGIVETKVKTHSKITGAVGMGFLGLFFMWLRDKFT